LAGFAATIAVNFFPRKAQTTFDLSKNSVIINLILNTENSEL
jgi:hypothetical protein